jgi:hypothetical protein
MKDLTKEMSSCAWSLTLFTAGQMASLLIPATRGGPHPATKAFSAISTSAEAQLGSVMLPIFRAGDAVQRCAVDVAATVLSVRPFASSATGCGGALGRGGL